MRLRGGEPTLGGAFARLMTRLFAEQGLVVMDAAAREFHALGARTLRYAIEHAEELEAALLARSEGAGGGRISCAGAGGWRGIAAVSDG